MNWAQRLIDDMVAEGYIISPGENPHEYIVEGRGGSRYEHRVLFRVDPVKLERYIALAGEGAELFYPGLDPMEAGYRLTGIHVDENVDSDLPPMQEVWFEDDEMKYTPLEGWKHPLADVPKGDYRWTTTRPGPDGVVREKDSRSRGGSGRRSRLGRKKPR